ncbi:hypothetical protein CFC21_004211 [Triticum aestivum]|uniref:NIF system FeS cluster assembly NifU N-terminal domain-containing protein n=1 Tax=Triticum aestivum TaxID=4565 RepID=A0A3B5Y6I4_WHEAT|nr:hypothetical protein CFC21_004211 [Triticum aestivum]
MLRVRDSSGAAALGAVAARRRYHERVVDHYSNPRNMGAFDKDEADVGTELVGAPAHRDVMKMQIRVDHASGCRAGPEGGERGGRPGPPKVSGALLGRGSETDEEAEQSGMPSPAKVWILPPLPFHGSAPTCRIFLLAKKSGGSASSLRKAAAVPTPTCSLFRLRLYDVYMAVLLNRRSSSEEALNLDVDAEHPKVIPMDLTSSHQVPSGPMTRARARALETEVTSLLSDITYDPLETWLLPKSETLCMIRYQEDPPEDAREDGQAAKSTDEEERWKEKKTPPGPGHPAPKP